MKHFSVCTLIGKQTFIHSSGAHNLIMGSCIHSFIYHILFFTKNNVNIWWNNWVCIPLHPCTSQSTQLLFKTGRSSFCGYGCDICQSRTVTGSVPLVRFFCNLKLLLHGTWSLMEQMWLLPSMRLSVVCFFEWQGITQIERIKTNLEYLPTDRLNRSSCPQCLRQ